MKDLNNTAHVAQVHASNTAALSQLADSYANHATAFPIPFLSQREALELLAKLRNDGKVFLSREQVFSVANPFEEERLARRAMGKQSILELLAEITEAPKLQLLNCGISVKPSCTTRLACWGESCVPGNVIPRYHSGYPIGVWILLAPVIEEQTTSRRPRLPKARKSSHLGEIRVTRDLGRNTVPAKDVGILKDLVEGELFEERIISHDTIHHSDFSESGEPVEVALQPGQGIIFNCSEPLNLLRQYSMDAGWGIFGFYAPADRDSGTQFRF